MLAVTGIAKVTSNIEDFKNCTAATLYWSEKDKAGEFDNYFIDSVFVGEAYKKASCLEKNKKIALIKCFLKMEKWSKGNKTHTKHKLLVMDFEEWKEEQPQPEPQEQPAPTNRRRGTRR